MRFSMAPYHVADKVVRYGRQLPGGFRPESSCITVLSSHLGFQDPGLWSARVLLALMHAWQNSAS